MPIKGPLNQDVLSTYQAVYRLASRPYGLSKATGGAGRFQFATIYHAATAVRDVHIRRVQVAVESASVASICWLDWVKLTSATTPATGNPAITPTPINNLVAAAEATCLALPTTGGTEGALLETVELNLGVTGAVSTVNPPPPLTYLDLYNHLNDPEVEMPVIRKLTAEGYAVVLDASASSTIVLHVIITFSER